MKERNSKKCTIRSVNYTQWSDIILNWSSAENWDMGEGDTDSFFNVDPNCFFITYRGEQPISSISMARYSDTYAHGGNFIVKPEFRNHICAGRIWKTTMIFADQRTIGCDGNWDISHLYEKRGFVPYYRNLRLSGAVTQKMPLPLGALPITPANIAEVIQYDAECTGIHRGALLTDWFFGKNRYGFYTVSQNRVTGMIGIRKSENGYRIGPFHADNAEAVETLTFTALAQVPTGEQVSADIPETTNNDFLLLAHEIGLRELFFTFRMYKGNNIPKGRLDKVKAIASLELG
ncbi:GNAT family N-acetyltransferase [Xenorhabdus hominickii]|uniref:Acetyltransferase n=1 Tax=Xenorhabdus hominickii TaxID=351679 RepID=A0A2G0QD16_XENHO|nr:GNAT family N-acetyltransferase [Xenorhabdus hominickii]AOM41237.1 hypothetical protein A9255_11980 [Xenorhabdus hominickii]PHM55511.1 acetyltransferase [Xenorhabdus hominickii]PHM57124.1 acetyltransferase [Xenorhabdus hominickii]